MLYPPIAEHADDLKQRLQREHDGRKHVRLSMRYLRVTGHAQTRQHVAALLGVSRNTVGQWRTPYQVGTLPALLNMYVPPGTSPSLAPEVLASIEHAFQQPAGVAAYEALRQWVQQTHQVQVKSQNAVHAGADTVHGEPQRATPESHTKRLMPKPLFRRCVVSAYRPPELRRTTRSSTCLRRMNAASAC